MSDPFDDAGVTAEQCRHCKQWYPAPVELHHHESECKQEPRPVPIVTPTEIQQSQAQGVAAPPKNWPPVAPAAAAEPDVCGHDSRYPDEQPASQPAQDAGCAQCGKPRNAGNTYCCDCWDAAREAEYRAARQSREKTAKDAQDAELRAFIQRFDGTSKGASHMHRVVLALARRALADGGAS